MDNIIFIVEDKKRNHGIKRRWTNILAAFLKTMGKHRENVNLIMTTISTTCETISFEMNRKSFEKDASKLITKVLEEKNYRLPKQNENNNSSLKIGIKNNEFKLLFYETSQEYESRLYTNFIKFLNTERSMSYQIRKNTNIKHGGNEKYIFYNHFKPNIVDNLNSYGNNLEELNVFNTFKENINYISFIKEQNFSLFNEN